MRSDRLKQVMQQIDSNFDERNAGFNRFSKFVVEAGQKGVVLVTKLDNGQYEVAPPAGALAGAAAPARPARDSGEAPREENGRRGRGRRGRGRGAGGAGRERAEEGARAPAREREGAPPRAARPTDGTLSLARAFQLMTQALAELRAPVPHETLRLRMVAMHGREDPLLDAARFSRLLRQANDAEAADVRKVGEDEYEVSPHRSALTPAVGAAASTSSAAASAPAEEAPSAESAADPATRENGQRLGLRFRRGSRGPMRAGEIPLIGVVQIEAPLVEEPVGVAVAEPEADTADTAPAPKKRTRTRAPKKKAAAAPARSAAEAGAGEAPAETTAAPKRPRSRPRAKKKSTE
jgi:ribonuclease E